MNSSTELALNQSKCIQEVVNVGSHTYVNICNGVSTTVPWGVGDWLSIGALSLLIGILVVGACALVWGTVTGRI